MRETLYDRIQEWIDQLGGSIGPYFLSEIVRDTLVCAMGGAVAGGLLYMYNSGDNISLSMLGTYAVVGFAIGCLGNLVGEALLQLYIGAGRFADWVDNLRQKR